MTLTNPINSNVIVRGDEFSGAEFSLDDLFRYRLWRVFNKSITNPKLVAFVMLNPSTATELVLDPTLRRCEGYAKLWGYDGFMVANLFALRSTDPKGLLKVTNPFGEYNLDAIKRVANDAAFVVCGWGSNASCGKWWSDGFGKTCRDDVLATLKDQIKLHHIGLTKDGYPKHPLYLRKDVKPESL